MGSSAEAMVDMDVSMRMVDDDVALVLFGWVWNVKNDFNDACFAEGIVDIAFLLFVVPECREIAGLMLIR